MQVVPSARLPGKPMAAAVESKDLPGHARPQSLLQGWSVTSLHHTS